MRRLRVIKGWKDLPQGDRGAACTSVGNFDGVHRGHQKVIALAAEAARDLDAPLGVITQLGTPLCLASLFSKASMAWWPRWTPSKLPMVRAQAGAIPG